MRTLHDYPLSSRQRLFIETVRRLTAERGFPPSLKEVGTALGCHASRAMQVARSLQRRGLVTREARIPRSLRLVTPAAPNAAPVPARPARGR
jgi:repressor LexA